MKRILTSLLLLLAFSASAENLLPNSSFELGMRRGWYGWYGAAGSAYGNPMLNSEMITNDASIHGTKVCNWGDRLISRPTYLTTGPYTLTFSAKTPSGATFPLQFEVTLPWLLYQATPAWSNSVAMTTSWERFTNTFQIHSNGFYVLAMLAYNSTGQRVYLDGVQIERGTNATAYAPMSQVEVGVDTVDPGNILYDADSRVARFTFFNNGSAINKTVNYELRGLWNSNLTATTSFTTNVPSGISTLGITLPTKGWVRPVCYIVGQDDSWDETSIYNAWGAVDMTFQTNHILGIHTCLSPSHLSHDRRAGFGITRAFSPITAFRGDVVAPIDPDPTTWHWKQGDGFYNSGTMGASNAVEYLTNGTMVPFVTLIVGNNQQWPTYISNRTQALTVYSNYCRDVVTKFSGSPFFVKTYEIWNEPNSVLMASYFDLSEPTNYASLLTMGAAVVRAACADCTIVGGGGNAGVDYAYSVWTNLSSTTKSQIDVWSAHTYPPETGLYYSDPQAADSSDQASFARNWHITMSTNKPIWNTETAVYGWSSQKSQNVAHDYLGFFSRNFSDITLEAARNRYNGFQVFQVDKMLKNFIKCLGYGYRHYNIQHGRAQDYLRYQNAITGSPGPWSQEVDGSLKPEVCALLTSAYFLRTSGLGVGTNVNNSNIEWYLFTNSLHGCVVPIFTYDKLNYQLTFTNGLFAVYDAMGNQIQTNNNVVNVGRTVRYLVSGVLNTNAMRNIVSNAAVASVLDTLAPNVSVDMSPIGVQSDTSRTNIFKWTGIDDSVVMSDGAAAAYHVIQYKWRFKTTDAFNSYSDSNHCYRRFSDSGTYRLEVVARDSTGNESASVFGPEFSIAGAEPIPVRFKRIKLKHVGMGSASQPPPDSVVWISENGSTANNGSSPFSPVTYALAAGWTNIYLTSTQGCFGPPLGCFTNSTPVAFTNVPVAGYPLDFPYVFEIP